MSTETVWHAGKVAGDWAEAEYEALIADHRWNGWAVPRFSRQVVDQIISGINADTEDAGEGPYLYWTTSGSLVIDTNEGEEVEVLDPDPEGLYPLGAWAWCWYEVGLEV
jgi:hypothetical protein